ncbi:MAG: hypothetical protein KBT73_10385 [Marinobacter sp.]|nr:hypothetical protein [Marinobacter sp.]
MSLIEPRQLILEKSGDGVRQTILVLIWEVIPPLIKKGGLIALLVEHEVPLERKRLDRFAILDWRRRVTVGSLMGCLAS